MKKFVLKRDWAWVLTGIAVVAIITWLLLRPKPPVTSTCFTVTWDQLNTMLGDGWNDPANANYAQALSFQTEAADPPNITIYPIGKDAKPLPGKSLGLETGETCKLPADLKIAENIYQFTADDADASGRLFKFGFLRLVPQASTEMADQLVYKMEFVSATDDGGETIERTAFTKPCPPYCPRPIE